MKRHAFTIAGVLIMALVMAVPAMAQQEHIQKQFQDSKSQMQSQMDQMQISGKVLKQKTVDLKGKDQKNQVVLLQTDQNERVIADLGNADQLGKIQIQEGKQLQVQGNMVRVSNQPVLLASQVTADGQSIDIQHPQVQQRQTDMSAAMQEKKQISGKVLSEKNVGVSGQDQQFKVALIELQNGDQVIADLGPADQLKMEVKEGEQVQIEGNLAKVGNQLVLLASTISAQGQEAQVQRGQ